MRKMAVIKYPVMITKYPAIFAAGWLFNFVIDVKFMSGFAAGWLAHSWLGGLFF